jgi:tRNA(His) guanylyltransferase
MNMHDELGNRIKTQYEDRSRVMLPRRTYTILRVDGRAFHTFTRGMEKPFDFGLIERMCSAAVECCADFQGCQFAYQQSDEVSFLLTDFEGIKTEAWFDNNLQKICSVGASAFTRAFNVGFSRHGMFDARAFTIADVNEVENYFIWRQSDATRNSMQMAAQAHYTQNELHQRAWSEMNEMLFAKGINFNDYPIRARRGVVIRKDSRTKTISFEHKKTHETNTVTVQETYWKCDDFIPVFTQEREFLRSLIPRIPSVLETEAK